MVVGIEPFCHFHGYNILAIEHEGTQVCEWLNSLGVTGIDAEKDPGPVEDGAAARPHLGLSGIRERLSLLRGTLTLETAPASGTTLFVRIPSPPRSA